MASYIDPNQLDLEDRVVSINRVTKVVKGGRRLRFASIAIVGDKHGHVASGPVRPRSARSDPQSGRRRQEEPD